MMKWMREVVARQVHGLQTSELDYLIDDKANTIGAMLIPLGATERFNS
ncbi:MAG: hypothetical protein ACI828_001912 [Flavobacteriales bacterium]|jgi:hypothetical protein